MSFRSSILTLFRSPIKTLITFLLLAITAFAFVSRGMEYAATERTIAEVERSYTAVGTMALTEQGFADFRASRGNEIADQVAKSFQQTYGENYMDWLQFRGGIDPEAIELVFSSKYVEAYELRHTAGGITSEDYQNATERPVDYQLFDHWLDNAIVIATCLSDCQTDMLNSQVYYRVEELLAGDEALYPVGVTPKFYISESGLAVPEPLVEAKYTFSIIAPVSGGDTEIYHKLIAGHHYLMFLCPTYASRNQNESHIGGNMGGFFDYGFPARLIDLTLLEEEKGEPITYEDYAFVMESRIGQILKTNQYTQELVYTSDMSLLPRFHDGSIYITEGRMITPSDNGYVCVINADYAARNGISLGDSIEFSVEPNTMVYGGEISARDVYMPVEPYFDAERTEYDFTPETRGYEVVGIWTTALRENTIEPDALVYALNTVFVPESTYPWAEEVEPLNFPQAISFRLKNPGDADRMQHELGPRLEEMGYRLIIDDMGYSALSQTFGTMRQSAVIGFAAMTAALLLSLVLITYLFVIRRKGEYAIMRALGVPARRCGASLLAGLLVLSTAAVAVGCAVSFAMMRGIAIKLATAMAEITGASASISFSPFMIAALGGGVLALVLIFAAAGLRRIGRKSPLSLLQGGK